MLRLWALIWLTVLVLPNGARAQTPPSNVNDCTLIRDPIELRNCILRFEGVQNQLPTTIESNTLSGNKNTSASEASTDGPDSITELSKPNIPGKTNHKRAKLPAKNTIVSEKADKNGTPLPPRPNPRDTLTHIEQIDVSNSK